MKVCVLGIGEIGLPTAKYILDQGLEVWAYDINPIAIKRAKEEGILRATNNWDKVPPVNVYIICVSTLLKGDTPDPSPVFDICEKISQRNRSPPLVSIESTIVPLTSKKNLRKRSIDKRKNMEIICCDAKYLPFKNASLIL